MKTETLDETSQFVEKRLRLEAEQELEEETKMENIIVHTIKVDNTNCTHEVAVPPGQNFEKLREASSEPAKLYPFQLDAFQVRFKIQKNKELKQICSLLKIENSLIIFWITKKNI